MKFKWSELIFPALAQKELISVLGKLAKSAPTIYDKAIDAEYLRTAIGGENHRLFDGSHDLLSAWSKVKDASQDDTFKQEVIGYFSALWKDATTRKGLFQRGGRYLHNALLVSCAFHLLIL